MTQQRITEDILPKLSEWFDFNCSAGCTLEQLKGTLLEGGFQEGDVDRFLEAEFSRWSKLRAGNLFDANAVRTSDEAIQRLWRRFEVLNAFNRISLGDRTACLIAKNERYGIYFISNFLSDEECLGLTAGTCVPLSDSLVMNEADGAHVLTGGRSSQGALIPRGATELVRQIESRISRLTSLPVSHGEDLQILRYGVGGQYRPHFDYFDVETKGGAQALVGGGQRLATVIMYLSDVEGGGATDFPELSLTFLPLKGAALLFASIESGGAAQQASLHAGCPVTSGEKWIATKWIRQMPHVR